jgi:hypothetical protein
MPIEAAKLVSQSHCRSISVLWLAAAVFAASFAGCMLMIMLSARHPDAALPTAGGEIMHMPLARPPDAALR